ncbi:hypothetical protein RJZ57_003633 [Blastomyces gilchristii]
MALLLALKKNPDSTAHSTQHDMMLMWVELNATHEVGGPKCTTPSTVPHAGGLRFSPTDDGSKRTSVLALLGTRADGSLDSGRTK